MKKIIIIEDAPSIRENITEYLTLKGHKVQAASDGAAGLSMVRAHKPDLVICDVKMPGLDGFSLKEKMNADETLSQIPVVFLSAATQKQDLARGQALGALAYLTKPFRMEELLDWVERID